MDENTTKDNTIIIEVKHGDRVVSFSQLTEDMVVNTPSTQLTAQVKDMIGASINLLKHQLTAATPHNKITIRR
jgi:hypothetical protein